LTGTGNWRLIISSKIRKGKMKKLFFVVSLVLLFCLVVYGQVLLKEKLKVPINANPEINAIYEVLMASADAFDAKNADRICSFFTDDFVIGYGDSLHDKQWLRELYMNRFSEGGGWKIYLPDRVDVSASGDLAYVIYSYDFTVMTKGEAKTTKGYGLNVLKKQKDGSWKFVSIK
jgi:ketosteroid isomerase-like protein